MPKRPTITDQIKEAVEASGWSLCSISDEAGFAPILLSRFMRGQRDIKVGSLDKLAKALGLELTYVEGSKP